jgi:hypothetical protein
MPALQRKATADEYAIDSCPIINGYENANPPPLIAQTRAQVMQNRIGTIDSRNRCRPGINRQVNGTPFIFGAFYKSGVYLFTDGATLYTYNSTSKVLASVFASMPFTSGLAAPTINGVQGGGTSGSAPVMFFNQGAGMYWWDGTNWNTASMPAASPNMSFPTWTTGRLITCRTGTSDLVVSDIGTIPLNWGPGNNDITVRVTLDSDGSDSINGIAAFQAGLVIAAKRGRIYAVIADPTIAVASWSKQRISGTIGVAEHNTMKDAGNQLLFLSESGQGVYAIALQPGTSIPGISQKVSDRITPDIQRINWAAVSTARAIVWQDLYILAVPVDGATSPNMLLVYSVSLDEWQGLWTANNNDTTGAIWRALAYNPSASGGSELLYAFANGDIGLQTKPLANGQYYDLWTDGTTQIPINWLLLTRGFHWDGTIVPPTGGGEPYNTIFWNLVQPYAVRMRFSQSKTPCNISLFSDSNRIDPFRQNVATTTRVLQLPHNLPWNLDVTGDRYRSANVQSIGQCTELQVQLSGSGDCRIHKIDAAAFVSGPPTNDV